MNTNTINKQSRLSDSEWIQLIRECRTSGLSDKQWCMEHDIRPNRLYYHIRRLTHKSLAGQIPDNSHISGIEKHEIVQLRVSDEPASSASNSRICSQSDLETAVRLSFRDISIEIFNHAEKDTIRNTLLALQVLC